MNCFTYFSNFYLKCLKGLYFSYFTYFSYYLIILLSYFSYFSYYHISHIIIFIYYRNGMGEDELENLYNELNIMAIVDHPNIVRVFEYYENDGIVFFVMEMMSGGELFDRIVLYEHYTEKQASDSFRAIVDAVRYCHQLGVVHRDLKPENLLYVDNTDSSLIKVSDFGLAKYMIPRVEETPMLTACGTPSYVAPEIVLGSGYNFKVDCWSLGVILYVMLCGFPPFFDEDNEELFDLIKKGDYDFPSPYWDDVSEEAKDLIKNLLIIDPNKRISSDDILKHKWLSNNTYSTKTLQFDYQRYKTSKMVFLLIIIFLEICNPSKAHCKFVGKNNFREEEITYACF